MVLRAIILTGGEGPTSVPISVSDSVDDFIVAADSGLDLAVELGLTPDSIVGDFDSLSSVELVRNFPKADVREYEPDKDYTDTEIALRVAAEVNPDEVLLLGGGGGRMDHLLGIISLFHREPRPTRWISRNSVAQLVSGRHQESGRIGEQVSLFPLGRDVCRMKSDGLKWPLEGLEWHLGDVGISNEFSRSDAVVEMLSGELLMILPDRGEQ